MRHFTPTQLQTYLTETDNAPLLLDVREPWEFEYCKIKGSTLIPMGQIPLKIDTLKADVGQEKDIILICHHGIRSRQIGYYMEHVGFTNITNLDGGVEQWAEDVEPTMKRY